MFFPVPSDSHNYRQLTAQFGAI